MPWPLPFIWLSEWPSTAQQPEVIGQGMSEEWPALSRGQGSLRGFLCPHSPTVTPESKVSSSAKQVMQKGTGWTMDSLTPLEACGKRRPAMPSPLWAREGLLVSGCCSVGTLGIELGTVWPGPGTSTVTGAKNGVVLSPKAQHRLPMAPARQTPAASLGPFLL